MLFPMLDQYACMLLAMFMCLDLDFVCYVMCYCSSFVPFIAFSCVLAYWFEPDLDPMVLVIIYTLKPTSKGLDNSYLHVYACLLLCFMLVLASLVLGFATLDALYGLDLVWLHPMPMRPCLGVTTWDDMLAMLLRMPGYFVHTLPFSTLCNDMLAMLVCVARWLSLHLYMLAYMFMHESCLLVCCSYFKIMKIWTPDPNLHLSPVDTTFCWPFCYACHIYLVCLLCTLFASSMHLFISIACLLVSCSGLCMFTHGVRAQSPRRKQKRQGCEHVDISQAATFSRFRGVASPIWLCNLFLNPFPSSLLSLLDGLY